MCGIVAVMGQPNDKMRFMFELLLSVSILRGKDSTGVAAIENNSSVIVKSVGWPLELIRSEEYKNKIMKNTKKSFCYIGHNRAATIGRITKENAHPFMYDDVILVHNGTLREHIKPLSNKKFKTDSQSITFAINENGIEWTWEHLDGAASLVYYNKNKLHIITNGERPLFFTTTKGSNLLIVASESWMIRSVCKRLNVKLRADKVYYPENNVLFSFAYNPKTRKISQSEGRDIKPFEKFKHFGYGKNTAYNSYLKPVNKTNEEKVSNALGIDPINPISDLEIDGVTEEEFYSKYKFCALCSSLLKWVESTIIDDDLAACGSCTTSDQLTKIRTEAYLRGV